VSSSYSFLVFLDGRVAIVIIIIVVVVKLNECCSLLFPLISLLVEIEEETEEDGAV